MCSTPVTFDPRGGSLSQICVSEISFLCMFAFFLPSEARVSEGVLSLKLCRNVMSSAFAWNLTRVTTRAGGKNWKLWPLETVGFPRHLFPFSKDKSARHFSIFFLNVDSFFFLPRFKSVTKMWSSLCSIFIYLIIYFVKNMYFLFFLLKQRCNSRRCCWHVEKLCGAFCCVCGRQVPSERMGIDSTTTSAISNYQQAWILIVL